MTTKALRTAVGVCAISLAIAGGVLGKTVVYVPSNLVSAAADPTRPTADTVRDVNRKPVETLDLAGVRPGTKIVDLIPGTGYFTRVMAPAVGPAGKVYAVFPKAIKAMLADQITALNAYAATHSNVSVLVEDFTPTISPEPVDIVFTAQNYHDFHNFPGDAYKVINKSIYDSLKPGGVYFIVDHVGAAGTGATQTKTLHRIEPAAIVSEVEAAGFKLEATDLLLKNPADPHTANVFDPSIRGKTDQIILKFRKPS
jgi:predicted methyltransferase